jgi:methylmalonyl-CoA mutase C-terminal domain/subunit
MIRVLLAKPGIDGHDVGVKVVARALRDAGMEVIYTGLRSTITETVRMAIQEDVDVIGVSNLSGQHVAMLAELRERLREAGAGEILLVAGGGLLREDIATLRELGIEGCFPPGTHTDDIIRFIHERVPRRDDVAGTVPTR